MPVFEFIFLTPAPDFAGTLMGDGPLIPVEVSMPTALQEWCAKDSVPIRLQCLAMQWSTPGLRFLGYMKTF
jgi:hypothetical protein